MRERIDIERLSVGELERIRNEVLRNLALRQVAAQGPTPIGPHDKHSSQHGKNTTEMVEIGGELLQPLRIANEGLVDETAAE